MPMRGTTYRVDAAFYDGPGGLLVDPTALTLRFRFNDAFVYTAPPAEIVHDSLGQYHYDWNIPIDADPGTWVATWEATMPGDSLPSYGYENIPITAFPPGLPGYNGCDWPVDPACLGTTWDTYDAETQQRAISLASATLYRLTAYRVGGCPVTVRPTPQMGLCAVPRYYTDMINFSPTNWNGNWSNLPCGTGHDPRVVKLPAPIGRIDEVKVDGVVLNPTDYMIMDENSLVWVGGGEAPWPRTQDVLTPDTEVGTFSVTYLNAYVPDGLAAYAAGLLAVEYAKACNGKQCKLPSNVVSIVRQGVSYELQTGAFPDGRTGVRQIDNFIEQWNPKGRAPGQIIVPGQSTVHVVR